ncbi:MAG: adenosylhomocysteinase [Candidatus Terraquivivens tikiterensis]|uniref:Adenosylhomocysteinase n=1 Tax=Candidatus Terraquivivens tikiterensis TaxID=1980982 RepID=A0A2R7Y9Q4_9ARCH|nr:MAG: adenosylhomocysteinase [Candidatus Terraquivivens tikiterensis]
MREFWIKDPSYASEGRKKLDWAEGQMKVLMKIRERFQKDKPLKNQRISACLHITKETGVLVKTLLEGGAQVNLCPSNPLSTQDEVAAALVKEGVKVYGFRGLTSKEYYECIGYALLHGPTITMDDGADLVSTLHKLAYDIRGVDVDYVKGVLGGAGEDIIKGVVGGTEETTTGVVRLRALEKKGMLRYPIIAVNDAKSKNLFDNPVGTGQSALDGIMRATNVLFAGKDVVVVGFGQVGSGIAERARGLGARVTVVEVDPIKALKAVMYGFNVSTLSRAAEYGDIFITATGNINVIRGEHFEKMKDGAILANAGHMDVEISKRELEMLAKEKVEVSKLMTLFRMTDGRRIYLLGDGRLVNLVCAEGHPSEVMDLSFSLQALCVEFIVKNKEKLERRVMEVPEEIDKEVARLKLDTMNITIDELTEEQKRYLTEWQVGT